MSTIKFSNNWYYSVRKCFIKKGRLKGGCVWLDGFLLVKRWRFLIDCVKKSIWSIKNKWTNHFKREMVQNKTMIWTQKSLNQVLKHKKEKKKLRLASVSVKECDIRLLFEHAHLWLFGIIWKNIEHC